MLNWLLFFKNGASSTSDGLIFEYTLDDNIRTHSGSRQVETVAADVCAKCPLMKTKQKWRNRVNKWSNCHCTCNVVIALQSAAAKEILQFAENSEGWEVGEDKSRE